MESAGVWMLASVGLLLLATGLPVWIILIGVAIVFSLMGIVGGMLPPLLLTAMPGRLIGLLDNDLLQALPLYVLMGALLNRLPLADTLFRVLSKALDRTGAGAPLAGLGLGLLLAPMNGSVGASVALLSRTVQPRLDAEGVQAEKSAALVCVASTLGVVVPPSLVLILLGDAMMRAHTEAMNLTRESARIINTQDVFVGALIPACLLLLASGLVAWRLHRKARPMARAAPRAGEWLVAAMTALFIVVLLAGVTLGHFYAVEAAAAGGVALFAYGLVSRTLTLAVLGEVLRDTMAITGALFALLVGATVFTLVVRGYGTDRWIAVALGGLRWGSYATLGLVLITLALCALVLDAFEMIFVVIPVVMPPLLSVVSNATWVAVLTLLILQTSFLAPPFGYAVLMVRNRIKERLRPDRLAGALLPYVAVQACVLLFVLIEPRLIWQRNPTALVPTSVPATSNEDAAKLLEQQLDGQSLQQPEEPAETK